MTALAYEVIPVADEEPVSDLDGFLWQTWKAMESPEGYRAEIIEGSIEVSPTGRRRHGILINRLRHDLQIYLEHSDYAPHHDLNLIHRRRVLIPDLFVALNDLDEIPDEEDLGVAAAEVEAVIEVVSPGWRNTQRDRIRKRREYARAGIPLYVLIDDFDGDGAVVLLTEPDPDRAAYAGEQRVPYGTDAVVPVGPAKGFVIGESVTRA
ncbi:Uma2 family endonuclease [Streptomyces sp. UNOC14_S4]|uniref:Uma2 family endonuclease n=1 Tax=Streptomyces sp. UNOC14_S4 TaxID=2872340 RepID=UPI001E43E59D|nr:Uma2 family endonuclease [Streptomyces sp. UNOC14_S4]MCC3772468.1 Uma2 family endonuclease [Streptomyces sp. UNOC14_S4]